ncbi:MAG: winged helix DNA-binding protein [Dehalococcoidia bacterium]|nr:winged helix DNA-binding protein [Dehalococcoidia bacterium]
MVGDVDAVFIPRSFEVSDISRVMPIEAHSVVALLDRLSERGLIKRRRSKSDRRTVLVYLTDPGYELLKDVSPSISTFLNNSVGALSKSELASLKRISRKLRNNILKGIPLSPRRADVILGQLTDGIFEYQTKKGK